MIRGTTPIHRFHLPIDVTNIKALRVTYKQTGSVIVEKTADDVTMEEKTVLCKLTQEETFKFHAGIVATVQMRILADGGTVFSHKPVGFNVIESDNEEILQ